MSNNKYLKLVVTSPFGSRVNPFTGVNEFHRGIDVRPVNLKTYAGIAGEVTKAELGNHGEGYFIQVRGTINEVIFYTNSFHNQRNLLKKGDSVNADSVTAVSGKTGNATGIHIHHEIFTYQLEAKFVKEIIKNGVKTWFDSNENRMFFDPVAFYKYI